MTKLFRVSAGQACSHDEAASAAAIEAHAQDTGYSTAAADACGKTAGKRWWRFSAWNTAGQSGFGTEDEARRYVDVLNREREINMWRYTEERSAERLNTLERGRDINGFRLDLALEGAAEDDEWRAIEAAKMLDD